MTGDGEFRRRRQEKTGEIRRNGKTWQWPDPVQRERPVWTPGHAVILLAMILGVAVALAAVSGALGQGEPGNPCGPDRRLIGCTPVPDKNPQRGEPLP